MNDKASLLRTGAEPGLGLKVGTFFAIAVMGLSVFMAYGCFVDGAAVIHQYSNMQRGSLEAAAGVYIITVAMIPLMLLVVVFFLYRIEILMRRQIELISARTERIEG